MLPWPGRVGVGCQSACSPTSTLSGYELGQGRLRACGPTLNDALGPAVV